jgi:hypothetical protein
MEVLIRAVTLSNSRVLSILSGRWANWRLGYYLAISYLDHGRATPTPHGW